MSINFKGINSDDHGLAIRTTKMPYIPKKNQSIIPVLNRDGGYIFEGAYDNIEIHLSCSFMNNNIRDRRDMARLISAWLRVTPPSYLSFSYDSTKIYTVIACTHNIDAVYRGASVPVEDFDIIFTCKPYHTSDTSINTTFTGNVGQTVTAVLYNNGNYNAELKLTLEVGFGIANFTMYDGVPGYATTKSFTITNMDTGVPVIVDCRHQVVYTEVPFKVNKLQDFSGEFLTLKPGETRFRFTSNTNSWFTAKFEYQHTYM
jgi:phage-related protein